MPPTVRRRLVILGTGIAAALALSYLLPAWLRHDRVAVPVNHCDLNRGPCLVALTADRALQLAISPRPIPALQALTVELTTRGFAAPASASLELSGTTMDMGSQRALLLRTGSDRLSGRTSLPVCVTGAMEWQADLRLDDAGGAPLHLVFRFRAPLDSAH